MSCSITRATLIWNCRPVSESPAESNSSNDMLEAPDQDLIIGDMKHNMSQDVFEKASKIMKERTLSSLDECIRRCKSVCDYGFWQWVATTVLCSSGMPDWHRPSGLCRLQWQSLWYAYHSFSGLREHHLRDHECMGVHVPRGKENPTSFTFIQPC